MGFFDWLNTPIGKHIENLKGEEEAPSMPSPLPFSPKPANIPLPDQLFSRSVNESASGLGYTPATPPTQSTARQETTQERFGLPMPTQQAIPPLNISPVEPKEVPTSSPEAVPSGTTQEGYVSTGPLDNMIPAAATKTVYDEASLASLTKSLDDRVKLFDDMANLKANIADDQEVKRLITKRAVATLELEDLMDPNSDAFKEFSSNIRKANEDINKSRMDLEEFQKNARVDPERYFKETPALTHALNAMTMYFEAKATGAAIRAGLPVPAQTLTMAKIDRAISDDISRQKEEMKSKEASLRNTANRYADNLKLLQNERLAELKTRADYLNLVPIALDNIIQSKFGAQLDKAKINEARNAAEIEANKAKMEVNKAVINYATPVQPKADYERLVRLPGTEVDVQARTPDDAKKIKEKVESSTGVARTLKEMELLLDKADTLDKVPGAKIREMYDQKAKSLAMKLKESWAMGAFDDGSRKFLEEFIPGITFDNLRESTNRLKAEFESNVNSYTDMLSQRLVLPQGQKFSPKQVRNMFIDSIKTDSIEEILARK